MSKAIRMSQRDLADIYQGITFYLRYRFDEFSKEDLYAFRRLLGCIEAEFRESSNEDINIMTYRQGVPGRKPTYSQENEQQILEMRERGIPIRTIASELNCSTGRVLGVMRKAKRMSVGEDEDLWKYIDNKYMEPSDQAVRSSVKQE